MRPNRERPSSAALASALCGLAAACGGGAEPDAGRAPAAAAEAPAASGAAPASAPRAEDRAALAAGSGPLLFEARERPEPPWQIDNVRRLDPGLDGWESEVLHDLAATASAVFLDEWVRSAGASSEDWRAGARAFLAQGFEGATALRPAELETVFDDGSTRVLRPAALDLQAPLRPAAELGAVLAAALEPFGPSGLEAAFEIIKVDGADARFDTTLLLEVDGHLNGRPVQQNATWRMGWERDGERALLRSIRLLAYEEVHAARGLLAEHTRHVFGQHAFWDREFRLGVGDYYFRQDKLTGNAFIGGQGLAVGDLDGDGLDDVYVCQQGGLPNRLFVHQADGTAVDAAPALGLDLLDNTRSALIVDLDGDGLQDLALSVRQDVLIYFNEGGSFVPGVLRGRTGEDIFSLTAADPDQDGDLDIYACRYVKEGVMGGVPVPYHDADNGSTNYFWRNQGGRKFVEDARGAGLMQNNTKFSLASIWEDFDQNGTLDLYVSNDFGRNNLYVNRHPDKFRDLATESGADDMAAGMGASVADVDLDGWPDILATNMFSPPGQRIASLSSRFMGGANAELHRHYVRHTRGNTLLCNRGDGSFDDVSESAGMAMGRWGWGALFVDLNNDGYEDIYAPNGFITNEDSADADSFFWRRVTAQSPPGPGEATEAYRNAWASIQHMVMVAGLSWAGHENNCVFLNLGGRRFANVSALSGADFPDDGRAVVSVDWDDDGRLDLIVKNRTAPRLRFLRNESDNGAHYLKLDLRGTECNRDAIGATVLVDLGERVLRKTVYAGEGYLAQSSKRLHFGLGESDQVRAVTVRWPGGRAESFGAPAADGRYLLVQGSATAVPVAARTAAAFTTLTPAHETRLDQRVERAVLVDQLPLGPIALPSFEDSKRKIKDFAGRPLLVTLWGSTSAACLGELAEFQRRRAELEASGLALVPLTVDTGPALAEARRILDRFGLAAAAGYADGSFMKTLEVAFVEVFGRVDDTALPTSLLFDQAGRLAVIYRGALDLDRLLADVALLQALDPGASASEALSGGRWYSRGRRDYATLSKVFTELGRERLAELYGSLAEQ